MQEGALLQEAGLGRVEQGVGRYQSVEFSIEGLNVPYQLKIWDVTPTSARVLVKEGSALLSWLKVGQRLNAKYYYAGSSHHYDSMETTIQYIGKDEQGRFRGHYVVGLELLGASLATSTDHPPFPRAGRRFTVESG